MEIRAPSSVNPALLRNTHQSNFMYLLILCPSFPLNLMVSWRWSALQSSPCSYCSNMYYRIGNKQSHFTPFAEFFTSLAEQTATAMSCQFTANSQNELFFPGSDRCEWGRRGDIYAGRCWARPRKCKWLILSRLVRQQSQAGEPRFVKCQCRELESGLRDLLRKLVIC